MRINWSKTGLGEYPMNLIDSYFENCNVVALDIETTGLDPNKDSIILVGILQISDAGGFTQFFCEDLYEEKLLLSFLISALASADLIITYNGASFDIPFINKRLTKFGFDYSIPSHMNFDLYKIFRGSYLKSLLPNMKQKTMEAFLGIHDSRTDKISGYESVQKYFRYLATRSTILKEEILLHNRDDIIQLEQLLLLLRKIDLHKSMFKNGFPIVYGDRKIYLESIKFKAGTLLFKGYYYGFIKEAQHFFSGFKLIISKHGNTLSIEIPLYNVDGHCYMDLNEFNLNESVLDDLMKYPGYINGYLLLSSHGEIKYNEINKLVKIICKDILINI